MKFAAVISAALVLGAASAPAWAQGPAPASVSTLRQAIELPVTLAGTQILVDGVRVNGQGPYRFLLDTGAQGAGRADVTLVEALGLPRVGAADVADGGGGPRRQLPIHRADTLEIGGLVVRDADLVSRDYNADGVGARGQIAGVLGIDLFRGLLLTIDYGRSLLRLEPGALPEPDGRTVMALDPAAPVPTVEMTVGDQSIKAHIDTGSMGAITVGQATADLLTFSTPPVVVGQARTVSGAFEVKEGRLAGEARLGGVTVANPAITIAPHFQAGNLGGGFLRSYAITLDMANHRVRLVPTNGLPPQAPRRYGLRAGDVIVSLNGVPVAELGDRLPGFMRASPLIVGYVRDGERREVTLTLD